jgi:hypothetical protein
VEQTIQNLLSKLNLQYKDPAIFLDDISRAVSDSTKGNMNGRTVADVVAAWEKAALDSRRFETIATNFYTGFVRTLTVQSKSGRSYDTPWRFTKFLRRKKTGTRAIRSVGGGDLLNLGEVPAVAIATCLSESSCDDASTAQTAEAGCNGAKQMLGLDLDDDTVLCVFTCAQVLSKCDASAQQGATSQRRLRAEGELPATMSFTLIGAELDVASLDNVLAAAVVAPATFTFEVTPVSGVPFLASVDVAPVGVKLDLSDLTVYDQNSTESLASYLASAITVGLMPTFQEVMAMASSAFDPADSSAGGRGASGGGGAAAGVVVISVVLSVMVLAVIALAVMHTKQLARSGGNKIGIDETVPRLSSVAEDRIGSASTPSGEVAACTSSSTVVVADTEHDRQHRTNSAPAAQGAVINVDYSQRPVPLPHPFSLEPCENVTAAQGSAHTMELVQALMAEVVTAQHVVPAPAPVHTPVVGVPAVKQSDGKDATEVPKLRSMPAPPLQMPPLQSTNKTKNTSGTVKSTVKIASQLQGAPFDSALKISQL